MKKKITVVILVTGISLLLTALAVSLAPDLLGNTGGIVGVFAAVFIAIMGLGGGTINSWADTLFDKPKENERAEIEIQEGVVIQTVENFHYQNISPKEDNQPKAIQEKQISLSKEDAQTVYLSALIDDFRPLSLAGMDLHSGDVKAKLPLEDIYISLNTTEQKEVDKKKKKRESIDEKQTELTELERLFDKTAEPLTALEALLQAKKQRMVLLGAPGTGKSTFVRYLSLRMARQISDPNEKPLENWTEKPVMPIAISLGRFAESLPLDSKTGTAEMMEKYIVETISADKRMKPFAEYVLQLLKEDGGLVLFDGLDEVANLDLRPVIVQAVESFTEKYAKNKNSRFLVTCRVYSYQDIRWKLTGWGQYELAVFSPEQIKRFISVWYDLHTSMESGRANEFKTKKVKLLGAVQTDDPRRLYEVARYPLILTMMAIVHANHDLPDSRARVYEQCVELLLEKWQYRRAIKNKEEIRSLAEELGKPVSVIYEPLYEIAFEAHKGHKGDRKRTEDSGSLITEGLIAGILRDNSLDSRQIDIFIDYCKNANGLLMLRGTVTIAGSDVRRNEYTFPHLTFEEFLASRHMEEDIDPDEVRALLDESHDRWRESVKFMGELYCFGKKIKRNAMNGLLEALSSPFPNNPTEKDWRALWLAGELLTYYKRVPKENKKSPYEDEIVKNLKQLIFTNQLTPRERADIADIVDQLTTLDDLHHFIQLATPDSQIAISKYLVTNTQYERFLQPENFQNKDLWINFPKFDEHSKPMKETWKNEAWDWLQKELKDKDNEIQDGILYPRYWRDPRFGINRRHAPVVGISWYEANAYCNWLTTNYKKLPESNSLLKDVRFRLPLDNEWTVVAGGDEKDRFAFGQLKNIKEEIIKFANTRESNINHTTPVWMYPQGKSPDGLMDMSGNVWEWQVNFSDKSHKYPGLRGGSWYDFENLARGAIRGGNVPHLRSDDFGFRVCVYSLPAPTLPPSQG